ncbi:MAG: SIMPL domain-containing protein [Chloroflexota bacterium]|nr:SIMPL domain-containing protein [Chloroflexota bacterium]
MDSTTITLTLPGARSRALLTGLAIGALAAAVVGSAFGPRSALAVDPSAPKEHMISVYGTGRVLITPDVADLRLGVAVTKPTVKEARALAADQMTKVIAALKKLGIADKDIQTTGLSLQPNYTYPTSGNPRLTGYTLSNAVSVTVRDLNKLGDAIDDGLAAGATTLDGVWFRVDNSAAAEKQAREQAMADAKAKAQTLAGAAGVSITGVASISEISAPMPQPMYYDGARLGAMVPAAGTPIQVGTNEVIVTVTVEYLIG